MSHNCSIFGWAWGAFRAEAGRHPGGKTAGHSGGSGLCSFAALFSAFGRLSLVVRFGKIQNYLFFLSLIRNSGFAEVTSTRKCKRKTGFPFAFLSFFRNFATTWRTYMALGRKNKRVCFVLLSFFRNFGFAEVTSTRKSKRKVSFPFAFLSFFRNFAP